MSDYGADPTPNRVQAQTVARMYGFAPLDNLKIDQYTYAADDRSFHLVDKHTRSSLWVKTDPNDLPTAT